MKKDYSCCIGKLLKEKFDQTIHCNIKGRLDISAMNQENVELLEKRTGYVKNICYKICHHHEKAYISRYELLQLYCCDSFKLHKKKISKSLCKTDSELVANFKIKPGQKLCRNYIKKATKVTEHSAEETDIYDDTEEEYHCSNKSKLTLNESASLLGISPIKSIGKRDRIGYGKQKVKRFKESITDLVATAYDFNKEEILSDNEPKCQKCTDMDRLINAMRENINISSKPEQVQILTITPEGWSIRRTCQEFEVSEHLVRKARKLQCEKGILAKPDAKKGHQIPQNVKDKVLEFYHLDDVTRLCPGKKDFVCVSEW